MYSFKNVLQKNPIQISGAIITMLNVLVMAGAITLRGEVVAGINTALVVVLGLFVANTTANVAVLKELSGD